MRSVSGRRLRGLAWALLAAFAAVVAIITLSTGPPDPEGQIALDLFLRRAHDHGLPEWIDLTTVEFSANVVMFVPIGFFGALALLHRRWAVVPAAMLTSATVELVQTVALPERHGTPRDVFANTLGAALGYLVALMLLRWRTRRHARPGRAAPISGVAGDPPAVPAASAPSAQDGNSTAAVL